ncbi:MAG: DUF1572 domain-containing protein [Pyrinomonadaceae bacterium]|nr:DUF1572 domain-containing protein [Pyrinomonadaceae bacterium]
MFEDIRRLALEALRTRITKVLPAQIRSCIEELNQDQLWWRPNEQSNSVGNLVLHVRGAVLHYLCRGVGELKYERDRPAEFATSGSISKPELLAMLDEMVDSATETFAVLDSSRLSDPSTEPAYYSIVFEDILGVAIHLATHTGQIVYVTKMLKEGSVNELWMQTHREAGAWKS